MHDTKQSLKAVAPALLFGLRLWLSVILALYIAFWLQLDNAYWAATSAAIVCQPKLGASLRKGWFRMIGTVIGAVFVVVLTAWFPQQRTCFLFILALWVGACALVATVLRNFMSYAAALAGVTAVIIAVDQLGSAGGVNGQAFFFAYTRASEICIGIVCAGIVFAATDLGDARIRLATRLAEIGAEILGQFGDTISQAGPGAPDSRPNRRELIRRVVALEPIIDEAIGESSQLRAHSPILQAAVAQMFDALASWRTVAARLTEEGPDLAQSDARVILKRIPPELWKAGLRVAPDQAGALAHMRRRYYSFARAMLRWSAPTPSLRLLADYTAQVLVGIAGTINGLLLLVDGSVATIPRVDRIQLRLADRLPGIINAIRASLSLCVIELLWIVTAWPNGTAAITFAAVGVTVFAPRDDQAYAGLIRYMSGTFIAAACAAVIKFGVLPDLTTFTALSVTLGMFLIPVGALAAQPWQTAAFTAAAMNFLPLLVPENQMNYDTQEFYNNAAAIITGMGVAAISFRLITPLTPVARTQRLLSLTLRDLRRLATEPVPPAAADWKGVVAGRLSALPDAAVPLERAQLVAAMSMGNEILVLRHLAPRLSVASPVTNALAAFAQGRIDLTSRNLASLDDDLRVRISDARGASKAMRARGSILAISDGLRQHAEYFDAGVPG
jgi:uncharacterized membrane protein YccC